MKSLREFIPEIENRELLQSEVAEEPIKNLNEESEREITAEFQECFTCAWAYMCIKCNSIHCLWGICPFYSKRVYLNEDNE